ncbi:MAG: Arc family DNA-binding protein [Clostridiaceae bacterium]|nr:Arc family DNA-binding protein [Clostridiaceae bacterium]
MATKKAPFTFHLDEDILLKIKFIAKNDTRSTSNLLEHLCKLCINEYEDKHGEIIISDEE